MHADRKEGPYPGNQAIYDNMYLWLVLGLVIPTVIFTVWGLIDIFYLTPPALYIAQ